MVKIEFNTPKLQLQQLCKVHNLHKTLVTANADPNILITDSTIGYLLDSNYLPQNLRSSFFVHALC